MTYPDVADVSSQVFERLGELGLQVLRLLHQPHRFIQLDDFLVEGGVVQVAQAVCIENKYE